MMNNTMSYEGYLSRIEFDPRDEIFVGKVLGVVDNITFHGATVSDLTNDFHNTFNHYLADCRSTGRQPEKPASGRLFALHELTIGESEAIQLKNGEQVSFNFAPAVSRQYELRMFGACDAVLVVFEQRDGETEYMLGKDDSGKDENAYIKLRLLKDKTYRVNVRMLYRDPDVVASFMLW